jgi:membrane fusion protein, multidrug efflux system
MSSPDLAPSGKDAAQNRMSRKGWALLLFLVLCGSASGAAYWQFFLRDRVTTDNAYAMADSARISARVPGTVLRVLVENDQPVEAGTVLLELDPRDYRVALDRAQAILSKAEAEILAAQSSLSMTEKQTAAQVDAARTVPPETRDRKSEARHRLSELDRRRTAAQADLRDAERDFRRFDSLFLTQVVPERQRDQALTSLQKARAQMEAIEAEMAAVRSSLEAIDKATTRAEAQVQVAESDRSQVEVQRYRLEALRAQREDARAAHEAARLNLSYCAVHAPIAGYIAQKSVQLGEQVQAGQPLMAVIPLQQIYVEANFKETQLAGVRLGQPVTMAADIYPNYIFRGKVVGIRSGTGAAFSLLPPENATGNWVKVVQRIPVRIQFDGPPPPGRPLRIGSSLKVTIHTQDRSGPVLVTHAANP